MCTPRENKSLSETWSTLAPTPPNVERRRRMRKACLLAKLSSTQVGSGDGVGREGLNAFSGKLGYACWRRKLLLDTYAKPKTS